MRTNHCLATTYAYSYRHRSQTHSTDYASTASAPPAPSPSVAAALPLPLPGLLLPHTTRTFFPCTSIPLWAESASAARSANGLLIRLTKAQSTVSAFAHLLVKNRLSKSRHTARSDHRDALDLVWTDKRTRENHSCPDVRIGTFW